MRPIPIMALLQQTGQPVVCHLAELSIRTRWHKIIKAATVRNGLEMVTASPPVGQLRTFKAIPYLPVPLSLIGLSLRGLFFFFAVNQPLQPRIIPGLFLCPRPVISVCLQNEFQSCACKIAWIRKKIWNLKFSALYLQKMMTGPLRKGNFTWSIFLNWRVLHFFWPQICLYLD